MDSGANNAHAHAHAHLQYSNDSATAHAQYSNDSATTHAQYSNDSATTHAHQSSNDSATTVHAPMTSAPMTNAAMTLTTSADGSDARTKMNVEVSDNLDYGYRNWKRHIPMLYDSFLNHNSMWPSLTIQWGSANTDLAG